MSAFLQCTRWKGRRPKIQLHAISMVQPLEHQHDVIQCAGIVVEHTDAYAANVRIPPECHGCSVSRCSGCVGRPFRGAAVSAVICRRPMAPNAVSLQWIPQGTRLCKTSQKEGSDDEIVTYEQNNEMLCGAFRCCCLYVLFRGSCHGQQSWRYGMERILKKLGDIRYSKSAEAGFILCVYQS